MDFNSTNTFRYSVIFNYTLTIGEDVPYLMNRIGNTIAQHLDTPAKIVLQGLKAMPTHKSGGYVVDIMATGGTITYTLILHQLMPVFVTNIVAEKVGSK